MTQEPQKNNTVLILIAIIGVVGTIVATTIGVIGNYNIEKFRQESELTRVALVSIVTQGGATQVSMASTISAPTSTPYPTESPFPKDTNTPTTIPTSTPIPTQTPDPRLFWDDFETGYKPEWNFLGNSYSITNGKLIANGPIEGYIGDKSWANYILLMNEFGYSGEIQLLIRVQDRDNHMILECKTEGSDWGKNHCNWYTVKGGKAIEIPGAHFINGGGNEGPSGGNPFRIEVEGNVYRTIINGEQEINFVNDSFQNGGIGLRSTGTLEIGSVEVRAIP